MNLSEYLDKTYNHVSDWLKFAEAKNGALVVLDGTIMGLFINSLSGEWPIFSIFILAILAVAMGLCALSFFPNLNKYNGIGRNSLKQVNIAFYGDIAKLTRETYLNILESKGFDISETSIFDLDLIEEIIMISRIAVVKLDCFKVALGTSIFGWSLFVLKNMILCF